MSSAAYNITLMVGIPTNHFKFQETPTDNQIFQLRGMENAEVYAEPSAYTLLTLFTAVNKTNSFSNLQKNNLYLIFCKFKKQIQIVQ
jgi:hypothetical protein